MNTKQFLICYFIFLIIGSVEIPGQSNYQMGLLPSVNLNASLSDKWSANLKIESRQLLQRGEFNGQKISQYQYVLTDYSLILSKKVGLNSRISGGYLLRTREGLFIHRFIQQYAKTIKLSSMRLSHRLVTDETVMDDDKIELRLRYRLSAELPLNGLSSDSREFYIKANSEILNILSGSSYNLELRAAPFLGYNVSNKSKLELGLDYRLGNIIDNNLRHSFWTSVNWFLSI